MTCDICGAEVKSVVIRERIPGSTGGLSPISAVYSVDHKPPNDCLKTINRKLDHLIGRICPNNGQEG